MVIHSTADFFAPPLQGLCRWMPDTQGSAALHPGLFCIAPLALGQDSRGSAALHPRLFCIAPSAQDLKGFA